MTLATALPAEQELQQGLLCVQAILCLIPDHTLLAINYLGTYLFTTMCRQAVHKEGVIGSAGHYRLVDLIVGKGGLTLFLLLFLPHAGPDIGDYQVGTLGSLNRVTNNNGGITGSSHQLGIRVITLW